MSDHTPKIKPCPICHELRIMPANDETVKHEHTWSTRCVEIEYGISMASGMECGCGAILSQDEVEDIVNDSPLPEKILDYKYRLLPCPFCGETKEIRIRVHIDHDDLWLVSCISCHAESGLSLKKEHAIELWNTRTKSEAN